MTLALLISLLVAFFWLSRFQKLDKYEQEPDRFILLTFLLGVLATIPSILLEQPFKMTVAQGSSLSGKFFVYFLWVGIVEEFFKFLPVRLTVYRTRQFNEVMDGMVYMVSSALGFAAMENVGYLLGFGFSVWFLRAILSYLGHLSFSAILGFYLGQAKAEGRSGRIWLGFLVAVSLHGLYDLFLVAGYATKSGGFVFLGILVWILGLVVTLILVRKAQAVSPFRGAHLLPKHLTRPCDRCGKSIPWNAPACHHCKGFLPLDHEETIPKA